VAQQHDVELGWRWERHRFCARHSLRIARARPAVRRRLVNRDISVFPCKMAVFDPLEITKDASVHPQKKEKKKKRGLKMASRQPSIEEQSVFGEAQHEPHMCV
jgi:hypothetical protein